MQGGENPMPWLKSNRDTIPIGKVPRKQKSSRFHVHEKVTLEKLPTFKDVPPAKRNDLFIKKLSQCQVLFDFNDPSSDLNGKEIKRQALQDMIEYVATTKGAIQDNNIYPHVVKMVNIIATIWITSFHKHVFFFFFSFLKISFVRYHLQLIEKKAIIPKKMSLL